MRRIPALVLCVLLIGCQPEPPGLAEASGLVRDMPSPAGPGSSVPGLFRIGDSVAMSWVEERAEGRAALRFAVREGDGWSEPRTVAEGEDWVVNWADRPGMVALGNGALAAHWLVKHEGGSPYAYDIRLARSADGGRTWSQPITPHRDGTPTEHGFVSAVPAPDGSLRVVWLDGRGYHAVEQAHDEEGHDPNDEMSLRTATLMPDGRLADEAQLDHRTCDCCPTAAVPIPGGTLVAYRDRSDAEIRDIAVVRHRDGVWSPPTPVHDDGWEIAGCPVNGPALAAEGERVALAWFTAADSTLRVRVAFSQDAGGRFDGPVTVSDEHPVGRVDVALIDDGSALVSWIEHVGEAAELRVRQVSTDGTLGGSVVVAPVAPGRATGMPRMMRDGDTVLLAWTDAEAAQVRLASARVAALTRPAPPSEARP